MELDVTIMSGAGNIFSVVNNRNYHLPLNFYQIHSSEICRRSYSKGSTEGLLVLDKDEKSKSSFNVYFYNPDGSFGMMCGNGARCAVAFALNNDIIHNTNSPIQFEVWGKAYLAEISEGLIKVKFPPPVSIVKNKTIFFDKHNITGDFVDVNSPHFVIDFSSLDLFQDVDFYSFPINDFAPKIRYHNEFLPNGTNVNFYKVVNDKVMLRTYERGVEKETGACGTGAISTAISIFLKNGKTNLRIIPTSQEELTVEILLDNTRNISNVFLTGNAKVLEKAKINIDA